MSGHVETDPRYWDCSCDRDFIKNKDKDGLKCPKCGAEEWEMPDSRINEIIGDGIYDEDPNSEPFHFYGIGRHDVLGRHPNEFIDEYVELQIDHVEIRAKELSELWDLDVKVLGRGCEGYYYRDVGFKWTK